MNSKLKSYLNSSDVFDKISDIIRIVNPINKTVIECKNNISIIDAEQIHCFDLWDRNQVCDNCISMRAYNDNTTYVKLEYNNEKTYMVTAVPYECNGNRFVMEIIKDITQSMLFDLNEDSVLAQTGIHAIIDNMNKLVFKDSLTGLYNRRYIMEKLPVDVLNSQVSSKGLSVIMADIDYFKKVNDKYGHIAGDKALKIVAETLSGCMKNSTDWVARFGGEEFIICMNGADLDDAKYAAENMRKALEKSVIQYEDKEFSVTASFGIYSMKSEENVDVEDLLKHADEKLYLAKKNGRNRVEY